MFEFRFRMSVSYAEGKLIKIIPDGAKIPETGPRALCGHNLKFLGPIVNFSISDSQPPVDMMCQTPYNLL